MNLASDFYTNVLEYKGKLLIRGVANGQSYLSRINYDIIMNKLLYFHVIYLY